MEYFISYFFNNTFRKNIKNKYKKDDLKITFSDSNFCHYLKKKIFVIEIVGQFSINSIIKYIEQLRLCHCTSN